MVSQPSKEAATPAITMKKLERSPLLCSPEWKEYSFPVSSFQTDGTDIRGLAFAKGQEPGKFEFEIDEVEIK
jgi:hypothetical protein